MKDTPATTPTPGNKDDYNQQVAPHIIPDDRAYHRYNTKYARGYAQVVQKLINDEDLSNASNRTPSYNGFINHVVHPVTGKIVPTHN